jgi:hypothetical protein
MIMAMISVFVVHITAMRSAMVIIWFIFTALFAVCMSDMIVTVSIG